MPYKKTIVTAIIGQLLACISLSAQLLMPTPNGRNTISINGIWKFKYFPSSIIATDSGFYKPEFDIAKWANIKTPGNWELQGFAEPFYGKKQKEGTGLYRTNFIVPENWKGNPVYLAFDGVEFGYTVWVNGQHVGDFASAFNRQTFDISPYVTTGKSNTLAVRVSTRPKGWEFDTNDDWALSGISRDVTLFSLPPVHLKDVVMQTSVQPGDTSIDLRAIIEKSAGASFPAHLSLAGQLQDASNKVVGTFTIPVQSAQLNSEELTVTQKLTIQKPQLWSAESPYLYKLTLTLQSNTSSIQHYAEHVGIRQLTWKDGVYKLNGMPLKLRGATHHDLSPINGRAITESEMRKDLKLMYEANINFVRTSHYPPNPRLLELCDSLGFYVMDEVPYGFGDEHLEDSSYLPILLQRAKHTITRDKNHPCIIVWSVGNENPVTDIGLKTGRYVKHLDETRPYCFPQTPTDFEKTLKSIPDSLDLLDDHYPKAADLKKYIATLDRPMIASEYAHALGLDFNDMESIYEEMFTSPKLAGGAVWEFFDQGILRKSAKKVLPNEPTVYVWPTADSIYDTGENQGTDGIVYANRVPQVDYWQARKVYTPIMALDDTFRYRGGKQRFEVKLINRYDFTNLSAVKCKWELYTDKTIASSGTIPIKCMPHDTTTMVINAVLPAKPVANFYYLKLMFDDKKGQQVYEKSYVIKMDQRPSLQNQLITKGSAKPTKNENVIVGNNYRFEWVKDFGTVNLKTKTGDILISTGAFARVGRKPTVAQDATTSSRRSKAKHALWNPYLLNKPEAQVKNFDSHQFVIHFTYHPDSLPQRSISGDVTYTFSDSGYINVSYRLIPEGKEDATETGLSFVIPSSLSEFRWVGKGPYEAYPGKDRLSEFGIYHLNYNDLYYAGNRQHVACAVFTNAKGAGFALLTNNANIAVERTSAGIVVSHNNSVAGRFNKYEWPEDLYSFKDGKAITGNFTIVPLTAAWPSVLTNLFGASTNTAKPFQPFYYSYDQ